MHVERQPTFACCLLHVDFLLGLSIKLEEKCSSETSVEFYRTLWCSIQEDRILRSHRCDILKSYCIHLLLQWIICKKLDSFRQNRRQNWKCSVAVVYWQHCSAALPQCWSIWTELMKCGNRHLVYGVGINYFICLAHEATFCCGHVAASQRSAVSV
jgi:hypothetical protein